MADRSIIRLFSIVPGCGPADPEDRVFFEAWVRAWGYIPTMYDGLESVVDDGKYEYTAQRSTPSEALGPVITVAVRRYYPPKIKRHGTAGERAGLHDAAKYTNNLIAAGKGDMTTCCVFDTTFAPMTRPIIDEDTQTFTNQAEVDHDEAIRAYFMEQVARYVESWIQPPLNAAVASMNGEPTTEDLRLLGYILKRGL